MFLFRLIFRLVFGIFSLFLTVITLPLRFLMRNLVLMVVLIVIAFLYLQYEKSAPPAQVKPARVAATRTSMGGNQPVAIEPVQKHEDGDSAFASDIYAQMTDQERSYYSQLFYWGMENLASGSTHAWQNGNTAGQIMPTDSFANKTGAACRHFSERLKVHTVEQTLSGIACQSPSGKWCKLKNNATPACGLGHKPDFLGDAWSSFKGMF